MGIIKDKLEQSIQKKGVLLEEIAEDLLIDLKFKNVKRQKSGKQYGYDLTAQHDGSRIEVWKFECKNLSKTISINEIAPKLLWHLGNEIIDRFVIVSVSGLNEYLQELLETINFPFPIEIWSGEFLESLISKSSQALQRLQIHDYQPLNIKTSPIIYKPLIVSFDTFYSEKLPYSFDYFETDKGLVKAYSDIWFNLTAVFCNNSKSHPFICNEINVKTIYYSEVKSRVFRQSKLKGIVEPIKYIFNPSPNILKSIALLSIDEIFEVGRDKDDYFTFELNPDGNVYGYYELIFEVVGHLAERKITMYSSVFPLHISDPNANIVKVYTFGKFYDTVSQNVLALSESIWNNIKDIDYENMPFLIPQTNDSFKDNENSTWQISLTKDNLGKLIDLGIPIEEKIYSSEDVFFNIFGKNWKNILSNPPTFPKD